MQKSTANIPMRIVGPIKIVGPEVDDEVKVPLATYETPLWPSVQRGAKISRLADGINVVITKECMTRSILVEAPNATMAHHCTMELQLRDNEIANVIQQTSNFAQLKNLHYEQMGKLLFIRIAIQTGDAAGHNMVTKAADAVLNWVLQEYSQLKHLSVSGNYCTDKKPSAVNGILGRGKHVIAEIVIPNKICTEQLRTSPERLAELNTKKNLIGTNLAGGLRSANAHFANMLLAIYLATGQDAANIVEGSQGITFAEVQNDDLYFSTTLPNIIVGTVGNGKDLDFVEENLTLLGCKQSQEPGQNARRLASIIAATVLCGELSLLAAQTNSGELMRSHVTLERKR